MMGEMEIVYLNVHIYTLVYVRGMHTRNYYMAKMMMYILKFFQIFPCTEHNHN